MRLQSIESGEVRNALPFGAILQSAAREVLPAWLAMAGYGFQDGGCLMFAVALQRWSSGRFSLAGAYRSSDLRQAQHVMAVTETCLYLDSDGAGTDLDVIAKLQHFEFLGETAVALYNPSTEASIPFDSNLLAAP